MPRFAIVVAADDAGGIGKDGRLPWHLPGDMAYFKRLTQEPPAPDRINAVIMGRVTWESIPEQFRPLRGRLNVVISSNAQLALPVDIIRARSLDGALIDLDAIADVGRIFVIGGGQIYREAVAHRELEAIYLTRVHGTFACDTFFPPVPPSMTLVAESPPQTDGRLTYHLCRYEKGDSPH